MLCLDVYVQYGSSESANPPIAVHHDQNIAFCIGVILISMGYVLLS